MRKGLRATDNRGLQDFRSCGEHHDTLIGELYVNYIVNRKIRLYWKKRSADLLKEFHFISSRYALTVLFAEVVVCCHRTIIRDPSLNRIITACDNLNDLLEDNETENALINALNASTDRGKYRTFSKKTKEHILQLKSLAENAKAMPRNFTQKKSDETSLMSALEVIRYWLSENTNVKYSIGFYDDQSVKISEKKSHAGAKRNLAPTSKAFCFSYELIRSAQAIVEYSSRWHESDFDQHVFTPPDCSLLDDKLSREIRRGMEKLKQQSNSSANTSES